MSLGPQNVPLVFDLMALGGLSGTATGVGSPATKLPSGLKALQVVIPTSGTLTVKVQNSVDNVTFFDVSSSTVSTVGAAGGSYLAEINSTVPYWRANITSFANAGTGTAVATVKIAQVMPPGV